MYLTGELISSLIDNNSAVEGSVKNNKENKLSQLISSLLQQ